MNRSSKFNFFLPQNTDPIEVSDFNSNFETIDANLLTKAQSLTDAQKAAVRANVDLNVANNLTTTEAGSVLDARQGKVLKDSLDAMAKTYNYGFIQSGSSITDQLLTYVNTYHTGEAAISVRFQITASTYPSGLPEATNVWKYAHGEFKIRTTGQNNSIDGMLILYGFNSNTIAIKACANGVFQAEWTILNRTVSAVFAADQQSGSITYVKNGKLRQLIFSDAKLPADKNYFTFSGNVGSDSLPTAVTIALLLCGTSNLMQIWLRPSGTFGQAGGVANTVVNGTLTWIAS